MRAVDPPELLGIGMDVDERLARARDAEKRVALRGDLGQAAADEKDKVRSLDPVEKLRIRPEAEVAGKAGVVGGTQHQPPPRAHDRQGKALGEAGETPDGRRPPAAAAEDRGPPL